MTEEPTQVRAGNALTRALAAGDVVAAGEALRAGEVGVPTTVVEGHPRVLVATDTNGRRLLLAFSSAETMQAWGEAERVGVVSGPDLLGLARDQDVDAVLLDRAGPAPVEMTPGQLEDLLDGVSRGGAAAVPGREPLRVRLAGDEADAVRAALAAAELPGEAGVMLFARAAGGRDVLSVATADPDLAPRLAEVLRGLSRPGQPLDVMVLDHGTYGAVLGQLPQARVR